MKKACAWCKKDLATERRPALKDDAPISHGICPDCLREAMSFKATPMRDFLNRFDAPVFLLDAQCRMVCGNNAGLDFMQKENGDIAGELGGDVINCKYSELPEGCGETIHCRTCTIRNCINETLATGKSFSRFAAYPDLHHTTGEDQVRYLISTERIGNAVALRIDDIDSNSET